MRAVAILGGLGSQMFKYAFYLNIKQQISDECYISTLPFYMMKMWNGYELNRIFLIEEPDIVDFLDSNEQHLLSEYQGGYAKKTMMIMKNRNKHGRCYHIVRGEVRKVYWHERESYIYIILFKLKSKIQYLKNRNKNNNHNEINDEYDESYLKLKGNILYDEFNHNSDKYINSSYIDYKKIFVFPTIKDKKNRKVLEIIESTKSVAIHIRRSDHMYDNGKLFERGYFNKAIALLKSKEDKMHFFIFSDDSEWCNMYLQELGLNKNTDKVTIVNWNKGNSSYIDMQLMTYCKHNVLAISSFGWWGYYLSARNNKIVCAPKGYWLEVENHI